MEKNTSCISSEFSKSITKLKKTGKERDTWESPVHLSMPEYVECALALFDHPVPQKPQHQPHQHTIPTYGATVQYAKLEDTSRRHLTAEKKFIQEVIGVFLYYGCTVDSTMLTAYLPLHHPKPNLQKKPWYDANNSSTTQQHTKMQYSPTNAVTWY